MCVSGVLVTADAVSGIGTLCGIQSEQGWAETQHNWFQMLVEWWDGFYTMK